MGAEGSDSASAIEDDGSRFKAMTNAVMCDAAAADKSRGA